MTPSQRTPTRFRLATQADGSAVVELMREYYAEDRYPFERERAAALVSRFLGYPHLGRLWVLDAEGLVVGYFAVSLGFSFEYGGTDAFLDELYLAADHRGRGHGTTALELAELYCREHGVAAFHLEVEPHRTTAETLYRKRGFAASGRRLLTKRLGEASAEGSS